MVGHVAGKVDRGWTMKAFVPGLWDIFYFISTTERYQKPDNQKYIPILEGSPQLHIKEFVSYQSEKKENIKMRECGLYF